jgi:ATP-independent RNA helicase DbpA
VENIQFSSLNLRPELFGNLSDLGYKEMTPIQALSLPAILKGLDVIGQGKTGSGKTAAFGLGLLNKIDTKSFRVQAVVLCPTRELADQVTNELRRLARALHNVKILTLCGGTPLRPQADSLGRGAHIVVGTPGRIEDHLSRKTLKLRHVETLVLDEADRMLEMGFQDVVENIVAEIPPGRQSLLFSATFSSEIQAVAKKMLKNPVIAKVESTHGGDSIKQCFYPIKDTDRLQALRLVMLHHLPDSTVVFCNTKIEVKDVAEALTEQGYDVLSLHGELEQWKRDQVLVRFANRSVSVLVATDVAARGLDIDSLDAVINFSPAHDAEIHTHRIGRTGRAGGKGLACTLYSDNEGYRVDQVAKYLNLNLKPETLPPRSLLKQPAIQADMTTLQIEGGKKQKIRKGDILGALTGEDGIDGKAVGKIHIFDQWAYVAIQRDAVHQGLEKLQKGQLKGRNFRVRMIRGESR